MIQLSAMTIQSALGESTATPLLSSGISFFKDHFDTILLLILCLSEATVAIFLLYRKIFRTLPVFSTYIAWGAISDAALSIINWYSPAKYFQGYLIESTVDSLLMFCVLVELAWSILRPVRASLPKATVLILGILVALAGLAIWPLANIAISSDFGPLGRQLYHLQETFSILRVVCFLVMASLSQVLSIGWRDRELQVATGLGFYAFVDLLVSLLHSHQMITPQYHLIDQAASFSYLGTLTYWVFSFSAKEQKRKEFSPQMQQLLLLMGVGARAGRVALTDLPSERREKRIK